MTKFIHIIDVCTVSYLSQPPLTLQCNPISRTAAKPPLFTLQLLCQVISSQKFEIFWFHNSTNGIIRSLGKGRETDVRGITSSDPNEAFTESEAQGEKPVYGIKSVLTVEDQFEGIEPSFDSFYDESILGEYWCKPQLSTSQTALRRSSTLRLEMLSLNSNLPTCSGAQEQVKRECAEIPQPTSPSVTELTQTPTVLEFNSKAQHEDPTLSSAFQYHTVQSIIYKKSLNGAIKQESSPAYIDAPSSVYPSPSMGMLISLANKNKYDFVNSYFTVVTSEEIEFLMLARWEIVGISLGITVGLLMLLVATLGTLYKYIYSKQRGENCSEPTRYHTEVFHVNNIYIYTYTYTCWVVSLNCP